MCYLFTDERDEREERDESHLARVMNPAVLPAALLVAAQLSPHTTSLLSSSCRPTDRLCRAAWSLGLTMSGTLSPPQSLTELGKYQTFPPQSVSPVSRLPPTTSRLCKLYSEKKPPRDTTRNTGWGFIISHSGITATITRYIDSLLELEVFTKLKQQ